MDDVISRQAALALAKDIHVPTEDGAVYQHRCIDPEDIKELPSAQPEQKKGEWIPIYHGNKAMFYQCPYCGARYMLQTRICGNCGRVVYHEFVEDEDWVGGEYYRCSACGWGYSCKMYHEPDEFEHCPHCGAEMEVEG